MQVFFAILIGAFSLGQAVPHLGKFVTAVGASSVVYSIIDRVSMYAQCILEHRLIFYINGFNLCMWLVSRHTSIQLIALPINTQYYWNDSVVPPFTLITGFAMLYTIVHRIQCMIQFNARN